MQSSPEMEHIPGSISTLTCLDVDNTVLLSRAFLDNFVLPHLEQYYRDDDGGGVPASVVNALESIGAKKEGEEGKAFDYIGVFNHELQGIVGYRELDVFDLAEQIVDANRDNDKKITDKFVNEILAGGTLELIMALENERKNRGGDWAFLTSGGDKTQRLKLAVIGIIIQDRLEILTRARIVRNEQKAKEVATEWYDAHQGMFLVPSDMVDEKEKVYAKYVRIIDDKKTNLEIDDNDGGEPPQGERVIRIQARRLGSGEAEGLSIAEITEEIWQSGNMIDKP